MISEKIFHINYKDVPSNPPIEFAESLVEKAEGSTKVVSKGGGSTIDCGKYVSYKLGIPHRAIPTTAGTGSEVTKFAVFTRDGKKFSLEDDKLIPEEYELIPELITTLPTIHTISSGLDALSQSIESFWSPEATPKSRFFSTKAVHLITASLPGCLANPENEYLRKNMMLAANYSGRAINITRTSICHAISYSLTERQGIPHGIACAMTLVPFMKYFGMRSRTIKKIKRLIRDMGVNKAPIYDEYIDEALESSRSKNVPKPLNKDILRKLL